ncbi:MAG: OmpA family protein [Deltaproteobacteria bacterium]|nr:OmpA family protein [Deltaproteobacteria bacterium]
MIQLNKNLFKKAIPLLPLAAFLIGVPISQANYQSHIHENKERKTEHNIKELKNQATDINADALAPYAFHLAKEYAKAAEKEKGDFRTAQLFREQAIHHYRSAIQKSLLGKIPTYQSGQYIIQPDTAKNMFERREMLEKLEKRFYQFGPQYAKYVYPESGAKVTVLLQRINEEITSNHANSEQKVDRMLSKTERLIGKLETVSEPEIYFETGKSDIKNAEASLPALSRVLTAMRETPELRVSVKGHADKVGSRAQNLKLSAKRAESIEKWLEIHGINQKRIQAVGYGESSPQFGNNSDIGKSLNRRVEFSSLKNPLR